MSISLPALPNIAKLWLTTLIAIASSLAANAATIQAGNVTTTLGPTFFIDEATNGGADTDLHQPGSAVFSRSFSGLLSPNQGPTRVVLTGFGFALHPSTLGNDATSVAIHFTYLGADEAVGGSDDVVIGTATGNLTFTTGGEYVFAFDTPLTANLNITGTRFLITITPSNATADGSLKIKSANTTFAPYVSVAGVASSTINPQRVNLAKFQTVAVSSFNGNRIASYVTDGDAGNDSRWVNRSGASGNAVITFPFPVEIGSAQVFMGVDDTFPFSAFVIEYLVGSTWTTIPSANITGNTNVERNLVFTTPVTATSFRLRVTDANIRLREFALYPPNGPSGYPLGTDIKLNLALQRPAVASSFTAGFFPITAVDGRAHAGAGWQTTTAGVNTLDIELVASTKIGSAHLYSGPAGSPLADFTLKSWDGTAWVNIPGGVVTGNTSADRIVTFTTPVTTTQVRLEFTKSGTTPTLIRELQIFPANTGNVGYALGTNINPSGAYADYETFNDAYYQIVSPAANRDIAVATGGQPALDQAGITTAQAQYQVLLNLSDGTYRLRNRDTGKCLSGAQLSKTAGQALADEPYVAMPHQDWILEPLGSGIFQIVNAWSGLVIDTQGGATAAGTALVQNTASSATTQRWQFVKDTWASKKGIGGANFATPMNADWVYNWGPNNAVPLPANTVFQPMQWGSFNWVFGTTPGPIWQYDPAWRKRGDGLILMGFNEPDRTDQSNIPLATCVTLWPRLMALNQPLVGPSPGTLNPPAGPSWHQQFYAETTRLGYRVEYNAIHTYPGPSNGSSDNLVNMLQTEFNESGLPAWLTEFGFVDWSGTQSWSEEDCYQTLAEFLWRAESLTTLRKYALFVFTGSQPANSYTRYRPAPTSNSYDASGNLTAFGRLYAGWDTDTTIRADKTYLIHNRALRKRMANEAAGNANPGGRTIRTDGPIVNWTLVAAPTANRYYVVSSIDGRRLSHTTGTGVAPTFAASGTAGVNVEWSLTPTVHGWHYLGHPASSTRLKLVSFTTSDSTTSYQMVSNTTTDDNTQWRFIVPLPNHSVPVMAAIPAQSGNELTPISFTATATDADLPTNTLTYSLIDAPSGSGIGSSTGVFNWTPSEAQGPGTFNFTVRVSDGAFTSDQPVAVTVIEVNAAPVLAAITAQTIAEGSPLTFTASATDADPTADTLTYSLIGAPVGAAIVGSTGVFTWTPTEAQGPGPFNFTVRVSDGALTHDQPVAVTVSEVNVAPVLAAITAKTVNEGSPLTFTASATDADLPANTLTYSLINAPVGAAIVGSTGVFTWTPTEAQGPGTFNFTVRVSDGALTIDQPVAVTVNELNVAPVLAAIAQQTVSELVQLTFTATATDADLPANTLTYSLINAPVGAAIVGSTGVFTWTPTEAQGPGTFNFTVRVSDGALTHDQPIAVTVSEFNVAPAILYWDTNGTGSAGSGAATGTWGTSVFWSTDSTGLNVGSPELRPTTNNTDDLFFSAGTNGTTGTVSLTTATTQAARSITFDDATGAITVSGGTAINLGNATAGSGIFFTSATGSANVISTGIILNSAAAAIAISNSGTALQTIGAITGSAASGTQTLTVGSSLAGGITLGGIIANVAGNASTVAVTVNSANATAPIILSGANTFSGGLTLNAGTLSVGNAATNLGAGTLGLNGGTLNITNNVGQSINFGRNTTVGGNVAITNQRFSANSGLTSTFGTLNIGANTLSVNGGNTNGGTSGVTFGAVNSTGSSTFTVFNPGGGATLLTLASIAPTAGSTLTFDGSGFTTVTGVVGPTNAAVTKAGTATLTLSSTANTYTGITTVRGGTLSVGTLANGGNASSIGAASAANTNLVLNGGTLQYTGGNVSVDRGFSTGTSGGTVNVSTSGQTLTTSGAVTSLSQLSVTGSGTLSLTGTVTLNSGGNALGIIGGNLITSGAVTNTTGNIVWQGASTLTVAGGTFTATKATALGNSAAPGSTLNVSGGTFNQTAGSILFGQTAGGNSTINLNSGTFQTAVGFTSMMATGNALNFNGGTFKLGATIATLFSTANNVTTTVNSGGAVIDLNTFNVSITKALLAGTGSGGLTLNSTGGGGTLTLSGLNTYTGNTTISAGTLALADNAQLKFVLGATSGASNTLTGAGTATLNGDFVIDTSAADALSSGTWTLENVTTLTGGAYGATFTVSGFTDAGSDKWTKVNGSKTYTFDETTGTLTVAVTVSEVNVAPVLAAITAQTIAEGSPLTFTATATDANLPANTLTYSLIGAPTGSGIVGSTGVFTWTPTEAQGPGTFNFTVRVSDGALTHDQSVSVTVNEVNVAPVLAAIAPQTVNELVQLTFTAAATDADLPANTLTYSLINAPAGAAIVGGTGVFTWTPTEAQGLGTFNFTIRVSDGTLDSDRPVSVTVNEVNGAPVLAAITAQTIAEGSSLTFTASGTDADLPANTLTYSLIDAPVGATIAGSTGVFTWTPTEAQGPGTFNFTVRVSDGTLSSDQPVEVTVSEANDAPVLAAITAQAIAEGSPLTFTASGTDADLPANTLTYSLIDAPAGADIGASTGVFTWTPTEAQGPGTFNFTVRVSDGALSSDQPVAVTVDEVNVAPVLAAIAPQTVNELVQLTFTATATDADLPANTLTYSLIDAPVGAAIVGGTGVFTWTPTGAQSPGTYTFTVRVSDGALTSDQPLSVTVIKSLPSGTTDTDGDGLTDLLEYAFGTNQATPNSSPFLITGANASTVTLQFPWNNQDPRLSWEIRQGSDLTNAAAWPAVSPGTTTVTPQGNIDIITITPATPPLSSAFYRLKVIATP